MANHEHKTTTEETHKIATDRTQRKAIRTGGHNSHAKRSDFLFHLIKFRISLCFLVLDDLYANELSSEIVICGLVTDCVTQ